MKLHELRHRDFIGDSYLITFFGKYRGVNPWRYRTVQVIATNLKHARLIASRIIRNDERIHEVILLEQKQPKAGNR